MGPGYMTEMVLYTRTDLYSVALGHLSRCRVVPQLVSVGSVIRSLRMPGFWSAQLQHADSLAIDKFGGFVTKPIQFPSLLFV